MVAPFQRVTNRLPHRYNDGNTWSGARLCVRDTTVTTSKGGCNLFARRDIRFAMRGEGSIHTPAVELTYKGIRLRIAG